MGALPSPTSQAARLPTVLARPTNAQADQARCGCTSSERPIVPAQPHDGAYINHPHCSDEAMAAPGGSASFECTGRTTAGEHYESIADMWQSELSGPTDNYDETQVLSSAPHDGSWYEKSEEYWKNQAASVEGMLGGLGELDSRDVAASRKFLDALYRNSAFPSNAVALDVGAGIGRVTKHLLLPLFQTVDMLEQNNQYLTESRAFVLTHPSAGKVEKRIACAMQNFHASGVVGSDGVDTGPLHGRYHLVWIQWCIIYLTDEDLISFLRELTKCLMPGGLLCLKDNVARSGFLIDKEDSSIMRSDKYLKYLFRRANLEVIRETKQVDFPRNVFPVRTYAFRPGKEHLVAGDTEDSMKPRLEHSADSGQAAQ